MIRAAFGTPLLTAPGTKWEYSNLGYYTLAEIIHVVTGASWEPFFDKRIFKPLGMTSTRATTVAEINPHRAGGYLWSDNRLRNVENWPTVRPSGAFLSTVNDLAMWDAALTGDRLLTAASKREMWTRIRLNDGNDFWYGFGWFLDDYPLAVGTTGVPMTRHEGTLPGFRAQYWRLPNQRLTVIALSNLDGAGLDNIVARIALEYAPELKTAYQKRWPPAR